MQQLRDNASDGLLRAACADNHLVWAERQAAVFGGGALPLGEPDVVRAVGIGRENPHILGALMDEPTAASRGAIAELLDIATRSDASALSIWALQEQHAEVVEPWLGPQGGRRGGRPHWMALDCHTYALPAKPTPGESSFTTPTSFGEPVEHELHCYNPDLAAAWQQMTAATPQRVWHAVQWRDYRPVGQVSINVTEGDLGVVGLHDAVFVPTARVKGPGLDRFDFFVRFALDVGSRYIVINAAAHTAALYLALGFRSLGHGQTWWFSCDAIGTRHPPSEIAFAEAISTGDFSVVGSRDLDKTLPNGRTPIQYAAELGRSDSADWLLERGAGSDLLALWSLGRRRQVHDLIAADPGLLGVRGRRSGKSLLHRAVERGDVELARFLITAGADPEARDEEFGATPLSWAVELRQVRIAALLRKAGSSK